ncbi:preprotein translocase subunit SecG [Buchnera aphidicola]|uniref:Protein-export membrane protein SecG n=1 Tax=Buchnera aphidicola (Cinara strobi) TaxID=1921549 RepID=A0A3B1E9J0_9GAMM|nr:Protein-export membrane protein SecG [Buchnera aphidicola (Cinara strobi)]
MYFFLLTVFISISLLLIVIIIFQSNIGNDLSTTTSDYSSQLFTENSKSDVITYTIFFLLIFLFIMSIILCKYSNLTVFNWNV